MGKPDSGNKVLINRRLTAMWSVSEAGLGGLLHAFKLPFTGILVAGFALLSVAMIAWHNAFKAGPIIRSWIIVSAVKFGLSPHSPFTAYVAVSFQAFFSYLCFRLIPSYQLACLVSCSVSIMESALQRILVLTILFGVGLWQAFDVFVDRTLSKFGLEPEFSGSAWLIGSYLVIHLFAGLLIGWWAGRLPYLLKEMPEDQLSALRDARASYSAKEEAAPVSNRKKRPLWRKLLVPVVLTGIGALLWYFESKMYPLFLRGGLLWLLWLVLFQGFIQRWMLRLVGRLSEDYQQEVGEIRDAVPGLRSCARIAWNLSEGKKGWNRIREFSLGFFALGLELDQEPA